LNESPEPNTVCVSCTEGELRRSLLPDWELVSTTDDTVWDTRGEIWARIWATRSEEEEEVEEESGLRIKRESCPEEREEEDREDDWSREEEREDDCPEEEEREEDDCPATAEETVSEIRGRIWVRIASIKDEDESEERLEDPEEVEDSPEERLEDPEEMEDDPEDRLDEDPEDRLEEGPEGRLEEEVPLNSPVENPEKEEAPEEDPEEMDTGLGIIWTNPTCSVLSSV